jgi:hypothetical protein
MDLNFSKLSRNKLNPNQFALLHLMYFKEWEVIKKIFSYKEAVSIRNSLIGTKYILNDNSHKNKLTETIISVKNVAKLLDIRADDINFLEFFTEYPIKVGNRILRPRSSDTVEGKRIEKKYLKKITSKKQHDLAIEATKAFVRKQKIAAQLQFLPSLEVVINNARWESWEVFITRFGTEEGSDHVDAI